MARLQPCGGGIGCGAGASGHPFPAVNVHVPHQVACDWGSSVVLWGHPAQLHMLGTDLVGHQIPWLGRNVEHVNVAGRLKGAGLANKLDRVAACVTAAVGLRRNLVNS